MTRKKSIAVKRQIFSTMRSFDYNPLDKAVLYNTWANNRERRLLSKISKKFYPKEGPAKRPAVLRKGALPDTKRSLRKCNRAGKIITIIPDDNKDQKNTMKNASGGTILSQTSKKAKPSMKATTDGNRLMDAKNESNATKDSTLHHSSKLSRADDAIRELFQWVCTSLAPFDDTVSKVWIVNCRLPPSLFDGAVERKCTTVFAFLQACVINKRKVAYVFFNTDEFKFIASSAWLCRTRAALVQRNEARACFESEGDFGFAGMDS